MNKLCENIDTLSMAFLDDELADEELRDLELHLHDCASCRAHVDTERDAIAELRRRLAPPPTPDVVRARLIATLDTEDALVAREERGQRFASWMLPGAASLVAVAALAVFVFGRGGPQGAAKPAPSIAEQVVQQQIRSPRIAPSMPRVDPGFAGKSSQFEAVGPTGPTDSVSAYTIDKVASWESKIRDREVTTQLFQVTLRNGAQLALQASVFDAREWDLQGGTGERMSVNGLDLLYGYTDSGAAMVIFQSANGLGYVFSSTDLDADSLVRVVVEGELVTRVAPPR